MLEDRSADAENSDEHPAIRYYHLGQKLIELKIASQQKVSQAEFERLAKSFGLIVKPGYGREIRYKSVELAKAFPQEVQLLELCRKKHRGFRISLSHLLELMRVPDVQQRKKLANLTVQQRLTSLALRAEIRQQTTWTSRSEGAGRPVEKPQSQAHAVTRIEREIDGLVTALTWLRTQPRLSRALNERLARALDNLRNAMEPNRRTRARFQVLN